jgi:uncharacterized protein YlaI
MLVTLKNRLLQILNETSKLDNQTVHRNRLKFNYRYKYHITYTCSIIHNKIQVSHILKIPSYKVKCHAVEHSNSNVKNKLLMHHGFLANSKNRS